jgi:hypothetical protein
VLRNYHLTLINCASFLSSAWSIWRCSTFGIVVWSVLN